MIQAQDHLSGLFDNFSAMFSYANGAYAVVSQTLAAF